MYIFWLVDGSSFILFHSTETNSPTMGLMHIVLVRAKPTASPAALATMVSEIQGMASKMPGLVTRITVGDSVLDDGAADRRKGFTHGTLAPLT